nr:hypothetical protein MTCCP1_00059 [uncultured bacterium]
MPPAGAAHRIRPIRGNRDLRDAETIEAMDTVISLIGDVLGALDPGHLILRVIRPALDLFKSETVAPDLSALMVVVAIALMVMYRVGQIRPACEALDKRIAFLKDCVSPGALYDKIDEFDSLMNSEVFLSHGWSEFIETCLFTRNNERVNIEISIRPGVFINMDDAEHSGLNLKWFRSLSGIFVGIGLLLTFIGLVAALYFSSNAINLVIDGTKGISAVEQTRAIQKALAQLLNTATFKFLTSISGLGCSIVLGFVERKWTGLIEERFQELCREIERCTIIVTPEQLANRQHHELCAQTDHLKEFTSQFAVNLDRTIGTATSEVLPPVLLAAISEGVRSTMPVVMAEALSPVVERLDAVGQAVTAAQYGPLQEIVKEFGATVSASGGSEIKAVAETLTVLPDQLSAAAQDLQRVVSALAEGMSGLQSHALSVVPSPPSAPAPSTAAPLAAAPPADEWMAAIQGLAQTLAQTLATTMGGAMSRLEAIGQANGAALVTLGNQLRTSGAEAGRVQAAAQAQALEAMTATTERLALTLEEGLHRLHDRSEQSAGETATRVLAATRSADEAAAQRSARLESAILSLTEHLRTSGAEAGRAQSAAQAQALEAMTATAGRLAQTLEEGLLRLHDRSEQSAGATTSRVLEATRSADEAAAQRSARLESAILSLAEQLRSSAAAEREPSAAQAQAQALEAMSATAGRLALTLEEGLHRLHQQSDQSLTEIAGRFLEATAAAQESSAQLAIRIETVLVSLAEHLRTSGTEAERVQSAAQARALEAMTATTERLALTLEDGLRRLYDQSDHSTGEIADRFLDAATAAQEASFQLAARVEDAIGKIVAASLDAGQSLGRSAADSARILDQHADEAAAQLIDGSQTALAQFRTTVGQLCHQFDGLSRTLALVETKIGTHAVALESVNRSARETETAMASSARALGATTQPLTRMAETVAKSMDSVAATVDLTVETLKDSQRQGQSLAAELRGTLQQLQLVWAQHENRFVAVDDSLARVLTSIIEHVDAHGAALRDHVVKIDTHLAQTVNNLAGNVEALQETASELAKVVVGVRGLVESVPEPVTKKQD